MNNKDLLQYLPIGILEEISQSIPIKREKNISFVIGSYYSPRILEIPGDSKINMELFQFTMYYK